MTSIKPKSINLSEPNNFCGKWFHIVDSFTINFLFYLERNRFTRRLVNL